MTRHPHIRALPLLAAATLAALGATCARRSDATLSGLCEGKAATQRLDATIDSVRPAAGQPLADLRGKHFTVALTFDPPATTGPTAGTAECEGKMGTAHFTAELPEPLRHAVSADGSAGWRIEGEQVLLDLNPKARDNNLVLAIGLRGGGGRWGLGTFAGEVASGGVRVQR